MKRRQHTTKGHRLSRQYRRITLRCDKLKEGRATSPTSVGMILQWPVFLSWNVKFCLTKNDKQLQKVALAHHIHLFIFWNSNELRSIWNVLHFCKIFLLQLCYLCACVAKGLCYISETRSRVLNWRWIGTRK